MTLYLKYRPQTIDELDLESVRETLKNIIKSGNIPHAFLFSGPKGGGKTSAARIIAKVVNCESSSTKLRGSEKIEPCNKCSQCVSITTGNNIDVVEIDAASHRGIDEIRALRNAVKLAPAKAKKKVYIIDEAHMLTTEAANALLKTLEEPPSHVMFIMATTNPEKLIETVRSRTVNIIFNKAKDEEIVRSLEKKVKGENLKSDKESLKLIARAAGYSFRDADKILELLISENIPLQNERVESFLFAKGGFNVDKLIVCLSQKDAKSSLEMIEKGIEAGLSAKDMVANISEKLRNGLLSKIGIKNQEIIDIDKNELVLLIKLLNQSASQIPFSPIEQIPLEIAIIEWCEMTKKDSSLKKKVGSKKVWVDKVKKTSGKRKLDMKYKSSGHKKNSKKTKTFIKVQGKKDNGISEEIWNQILSGMKSKNTSTEALLRATRPLYFDGSNLTLGVFYNFHKERLESILHKNILENVCQTILGKKVKVVCTLTEAPKKIEGEKSKKSEVVLTETEDEDIIKIAEEIFVK